MFQQFWNIFESAERDRAALQQEQKEQRRLQKEEIKKNLLSKDHFKQHNALSRDIWETPEQPEHRRTGVFSAETTVWRTHTPRED